MEKSLAGSCGQGRALRLLALPSVFGSLTSAAGNAPGDVQANPRVLLLNEKQVVFW